MLNQKAEEFLGDVAETTEITRDPGCTPERDGVKTECLTTVLTYCLAGVRFVRDAIKRNRCCGVGGVLLWLLLEKGQRLCGCLLLPKTLLVLLPVRR
jgi:hypothetical protein